MREYKSEIYDPFFVLAYNFRKQNEGHTSNCINDHHLPLRFAIDLFGIVHISFLQLHLPVAVEIRKVEACGTPKDKGTR